MLWPACYLIRQVLPVMVSDVSYDRMPIADGGAAMQAYVRMARGDIRSAAEIRRIRRALLAYCTQDTLSMVKIHERLGAVVEECAMAYFYVEEVVSS